MNYLKIYNALIYDATHNPKSDSYKEIHHIIPQCMAGDNSRENLIELTARQHYLAHWLLYKIYKTSSLVHAWHCMSRISAGQQNRTINSHLFQYCKLERKKYLSQQMSGSGNNFYGKRHTTESRKKMSDSQKGKSHTIETRKKMSASQAGKLKTVSHRQKIGRGGMIMLQNIHTKEIIRVIYSDDRCNSAEWVNPRKLKPELKYKCLRCDMMTTPSNLKRWHNENCKKGN